VRAANVARTVERGKNPEGGTGEGLAILTFRKEPQGTERVTRGTRRRRARGSKNPRRGNTELLDVSVARAGGTKTGARAAKTRFNSEGEGNSRRGSSRTLVLEVRSVAENPEAVSNGEGGALEATRVLRG